MRPLGGGRVGEALRLGRLNELKTSANLHKFLSDCIRVDPWIPVQIFISDFEVGLVTRRCALLEIADDTTFLDGDFGVLAASVDRLPVVVNNIELRGCDESLHKRWIEMHTNQSAKFFLHMMSERTPFSPQ